MGMRSLNGESDGKGKMKEKLRLAVFGHKRWSREGGVEIVVKELCTRMAQQVTSQPFCAIRVQSSLTTISTPPSLDNRFCPNIAIASFLLINLSHNPTQFLHLYFS